MRRIIVTGHACEIPSVGSNVTFTLECSPLNMGSAVRPPEHGHEPVETVEVFVNGHAERADLRIRGDLESMEELARVLRKECALLRRRMGKESGKEAKAS